MKTLIYLFLGLLLYGCSTDNIENIVVNKVQLDDEISLINQVLPQLNNSNPRPLNNFQSRRMVLTRRREPIPTIA